MCRSHTSRPVRAEVGRVPPLATRGCRARRSPRSGGSQRNCRARESLLCNSSPEEDPMARGRSVSRSASTGRFRLGRGTTFAEPNDDRASAVERAFPIGQSKCRFVKPSGFGSLLAPMMTPAIRRRTPRASVESRRSSRHDVPNLTHTDHPACSFHEHLHET